MGGRSKGGRRKADEESAHRPRRLIVAVAAVGVLGVTAASVLVTRGGDDQPAAKKAAGKVHTVAVARSDMANSASLQGTLGYADEQAVAGLAGRVTWLPAPDAVVSRGRQLFRVDDQPVALFYGATPLFRPLGEVGLVGRDVKVVDDNLRALGYDTGSQPVVGTEVTQPAGATASTDPAGATPPSEGGTAVGRPAVSHTDAPSGRAAPVKVRKGDAVLTASLLDAVRRWQTSVGMTPSGLLDAGDVVVLPFEVRVTAVTARLGADAAAPLLKVASTRQVVTVEVEPLEAGSIRTADKVTVTLPDGSTTRGTVAGIGKVVAAGSEGAGSGDAPKITATVEVQDKAALRDLDAAPVQVEFSGKVEHGVLTVPVGTLLALSEGGYGVQLSGGRLIPVTTGLFVKGMVEVSGPGLSEGTKVVTTS